MNIYVAISIQYIFIYYEDKSSMITELKTCMDQFKAQGNEAQTFLLIKCTF